MCQQVRIGTCTDTGGDSEDGWPQRAKPGARKWEAAARTWRAFWVVMSPTSVRTPRIALMGTRSMPMIRLLTGIVFCATCSQPPGGGRHTLDQGALWLVATYAGLRTSTYAGCDKAGACAPGAAHRSTRLLHLSRK